MDLLGRSSLISPGDRGCAACTGGARSRLWGLYGWVVSVDAMWPDTVCGQESVHGVNAGVGDESVWSHEAWRHGELPARPDTVWPTAAVSVTASDQGPHSAPATGLTALVLEIA